MLYGPCPRTAEHFARHRGRAESCVQCEAEAWALARDLLPWTAEARELVRECLGSYERNVPAPAAALHTARVAMGVVSALEVEQKKRQWQEKWERNRGSR